MLTHFKTFTRDECGFIVTTELVLIATLCVLGLVTGLSCIRDAINGELGDVAQAIGSLNQSYHYTGFHGCVSPKCGVHAWTAGSAFTDLRDEEARGDLDDGPVPERVIQAAPKKKPCPAKKAAPAPQPEATVVPCPASTVECPTNPVCCEQPSAPVGGIVIDSPSCCDPSTSAPSQPVLPATRYESRVIVNPVLPNGPPPSGSGFLVW